MTWSPYEDPKFEVGRKYDVFTRDGTCYTGAEYLEGTVEGGLWFQYGIARLFIHESEYDYAEDH